MAISFKFALPVFAVMVLLNILRSSSGQSHASCPSPRGYFKPTYIPFHPEYGQSKCSFHFLANAYVRNALHSLLSFYLTRWKCLWQILTLKLVSFAAALAGVTQAPRPHAWLLLVFTSLILSTIK